MDLFTRVNGNPVVTPQMSGGDKVYNPGVVYDDATGMYVMYLRVHFARLPRWPANGPLWTRLMSFILSFYVRDEWHSQIWIGTSPDGINWSDFRPFLVPDRLNPGQLRGFEDARIVLVENFGYVLTYAVYDGRIVRMHVATSPDLAHWTFHGPMPDWPFVGSGGVHVDWDSNPLRTVQYNPLWPDGPDVRSKSGSAAPKLIHGRLYFVLGEGGIWVASCRPDMTDWEISHRPLITGRPGTNLPDNVTVEAGPPLLWRPYGWLMLYHGINQQRQYQLMIAVLSHDLNTVLWRSDFAIFGPRESYEVSPGAIDVIPGAREALSAGDHEVYDRIITEAIANGTLPRVTFVTACEDIGDTMRLTYGTRDEVICVAEAAIADVEAVIPDEIRRAA